MRLLILNCMSRNALAVAKSLSDEHELIGATQQVPVPLPLLKLLATGRYRALGYHLDPYLDIDAFVASVIELIARFKVQGVIGTGTATTDALIEKQDVIYQASGAKVLAGPSDVVLQLTDKWHITRIAGEAKVPMPLTCAIPDLTRIAETVRDAGMGVPFVIKPRRRSASIGLRIFRDWEHVAAFESLAARVGQEGQEDGYVAQAFMHGELYDGNCVANNGTMIAVMSQARVVTAWDFGGGGIVNLTCAEPEIIQAVRRLVAVTKFTGVAQFEFLRDQSGRFFLIECNPKIFGTTYLPTAAGINLVRCAVDAILLGKDVPEQTDYEQGLLYRWIFPDCLAYWISAPRSPRRIWRRMCKSLARHGAQRTLSNISWEDFLHQCGNICVALASGKSISRV